MSAQLIDSTDQSTIKASRTRALAGKALLIFFTIMILLTWAGKILQEMTIATITPASVQRGALEKQINATGTLSAAGIHPLVIEDAVRVESIPVSVGESVASGDVLLILDYTALEEELQKGIDTASEDRIEKRRQLDWAAADLSATTLRQLEIRLPDLDRLETAYLLAQEVYENAVAGKGEMAAAAEKQAADSAENAYENEKRRLDRDAATRDYRTQREALRKAEAVYAEARREYHDTLSEAAQGTDGRWRRFVHAPIAGSITQLSANAGEILSTAVPVLVLSVLEEGLVLTVQVSEDQVQDLSIGDVAEITVGDLLYQGSIRTILPAADVSGNFELRFLLPGDAGVIGGKARISLKKRTQNYDILLPVSALHSDDAGDFIYVVQQSDSSLGSQMTARRVDVYVLDEDAGRVALQSGVSQRDIVVGRSDRGISDGDRIRFAED